VSVPSFARARPDKPRTHIPTERELELERELRKLRKRLAIAEREASEASR
jgi:hypothetical protein